MGYKYRYRYPHMTPEKVEEMVYMRNVEKKTWPYIAAYFKVGESWAKKYTYSVTYRGVPVVTGWDFSRDNLGVRD